MRRHSALTLTIAIAITLAALTPTRAASPPGWVATPETSPCRPASNAIVEPSVALFGETVDITLTVKAVCPPERVPLHLVLTLDASDSIAGPAERQMKQAAAALVRGLDMGEYAEVRTAVVEFNDDARRLCLLTDDEERVINAIARVGPDRPFHRSVRDDAPDGNTRIDLGITEAHRVLSQGRRGSSYYERTEVLFVMSDGHSDTECGEVVQAAHKAKQQGVLVIAVCLGTDCDERCMRNVASAPRYYFRAENAGHLTSIFHQIRERLINIDLRRLVVEETLSPTMAYVPGSAAPPPAEHSPDGGWMKWVTDYVPREGVTYTLKAKPLRVGNMPVNQVATGKLIDHRGRERTWTFDVPWVAVLAPSPVQIPLVTPDPQPTIIPAR
jgi:uncharacterized protein YegL